MASEASAVSKAGVIGKLQEFNPDQESIAAYLERFDLYVTVNGIAEAQRVPTLLLVMGRIHYTLIRDLVSPAKPENQTLDKVKDLLRKDYDPEPIVIAERFHFYHAASPETWRVHR